MGSSLTFQNSFDAFSVRLPILIANQMIKFFWSFSFWTILCSLSSCSFMSNYSQWQLEAVWDELISACPVTYNLCTVYMTIVF